MAAALFTLLATFVSEQCANTMVAEGDLFNAACVKLSISKALSYLVILGATIVKVPQIVKFIRSKSCQGVSLLSQCQELTANTFTLSYYVVKGFPFSTWGEVSFLIVQLLVIVSLMLFLEKRTAFIPLALGVWAAVLYTITFGPLTHMVDTLFMAAIPVQSISRLFQIFTNFRSGSTGQLSFITSLMNLAGTAARVFSSIQEVPDKTVLASFLIFTTLNATIVLQFLWYWNSPPQGAKKAQGKGEGKGDKGKSPSRKKTE